MHNEREHRHRRFFNTARTCLMFTLFTFAIGNQGSAQALEVKDVPAEINLVIKASTSYTGQYPALLGTSEKNDSNIEPFTKWTAMFDRFEREINSGSAQKMVQDWHRSLRPYKGLSIKAMADGVNDLMNQKPYIVDQRNWGKSDYWATPVEFMARGGDCEDFAIAKYTAMRALGVPENRLRLAIVQDTLKNIPHAVLVVYTEEGPYILDNQIKTLVDASYAGRYRPIYSINRTAWWLHSEPEARLAMAR